MTAIGEYLIEQGFTPFVWRKGAWVPGTLRQFSTMEPGGSTMLYELDGERYTVGLKYFGIPPGLVAPEPTIAALGTDGHWYGMASNPCYTYPAPAWISRALDGMEPADIIATLRCNGTFLIHLDEEETRQQAAFIAQCAARA